MERALLRRKGWPMKKWLPIVRSFAVITVGAVIYALAYNIFYAPNDIAFGGVTGISQMVNRLFSYLPVGVLIIVINIPLFVLAWRFLGGKMLIGSLYGMLLSSALLDVFGNLIRFPTLEEPLMACIFGGAVLGTSVGMIAREGASLGGTDIAARLLKLRFPAMSAGQLLRGLDLVVIAGVSIVFQQLNSALMGILALFISTYSMDRVLFGTDPSKVAYIISDKSEVIAKTIITQLHRGVTILHGAGAWSMEEKNVLLCAFKKRQIVELKRTIKELDPKAFLIVCEAYEVLGDGFLPHDPKQQKKSIKLPPKPWVKRNEPEATTEPLEAQGTDELEKGAEPHVEAEVCDTKGEPE